MKTGCWKQGLFIFPWAKLSEWPWRILAARFARWMEERGYDLWLTPTLGAPPPALGFFEPVTAGQRCSIFIEFLPFMTLNNMTEQPGLTSPLSWKVDGWPIGIHFTAACGNEAVLLRIAAQLDEARPWPPVCA